MEYLNIKEFAKSLVISKGVLRSYVEKGVIDKHSKEGVEESGQKIFLWSENQITKSRINLKKYKRGSIVTSEEKKRNKNSRNKAIENIDNKRTKLFNIFLFQNKGMLK